MLLDLSKTIAKPLQCDDCDIDMRFLGSVRIKRVFFSTIMERKFFLCPNCGRLSYVLVAIHAAPRSSSVALCRPA